MINSDLIATIQERLDDPTGARYTSDIIIRELKLASAEIRQHRTLQRRLFQSSGTFTLTSGTDTYDLSTKFTDYGGKVYEVIWGTVTDPGTDTSQKLHFVQPEQIYDNQYNNSGGIGYYTVIGTNIIFSGVPASADSGISVKVRYATTDGTYANDGVETTLGKQFPHLLVNKVAYELSMSEQDGEIASSADRLGKSYKEGLDMAIEALSRQSGEPRFIQTSDSGLV